jgi:hypothetical protein
MDASPNHLARVQRVYPSTSDETVVPSGDVVKPFLGYCVHSKDRSRFGQTDRLACQTFDLTV